MVYALACFLSISDDSQPARECLSAKRRAFCMTRACHSIFKGYLTYTGGQYSVSSSSLSLSLQTLTPNTANMVSNSLAQRMRKLQTKLLSIRLGSGAFVLPKDIKKIHLRFAPKINGGHMGPRYVLVLL